MGGMGLPNIPGFAFVDPTKQRFHLSQTLGFNKGYRMFRNVFPGIGDTLRAKDTLKQADKMNITQFDTSLTYGRSKSMPGQNFKPVYAHYSSKCLCFNAFFKQSVFGSPLEHFRVRQVRIVYFLEDDTMTVIEPKTLNSGLLQGRLVKRSKLVKNQKGEYWHWKDLQVGKDICLNGVVYHTVDCDLWTKEFMASQGLIMNDKEQMPTDSYTDSRLLERMAMQKTTKTKSSDDKQRRYLEFDGKILRFFAVWDDRDSELGEIGKYEVLYFLCDDNVAVKQVHTPNDGKDPTTMLLKKMKLPKMYNDTPTTYPAICMERTDAEVAEYYQPKDFLVGNTVFILGRKLLLYDCDAYTRNYYRTSLCITQGPRIEVDKPKSPLKPKQMPPHDGIGSLEDSLQNTLRTIPIRPKKDVFKQIQNCNKYLRYEMKMNDVHPEDSIRRFILYYTLSDSSCRVVEPRIRNSGWTGGKYLRNFMLVKPGSDPLNPTYYSPIDFYIGAKIQIYGQLFIITGADLYVYRYMQSNPEKFPCEVIENIRNYMFQQGYLKDDIEDTLDVLREKEKKAERDAIGKNMQAAQGELERCIERAQEGRDFEREKQILDRLNAEYEESLKHTYEVPEHGIMTMKRTCEAPIIIGGDPQVQPCGESDEEGERLTPKHVDSDEVKQKKYYDSVLKSHYEICENINDVECSEPPPLDDRTPVRAPKTPPYQPLIVSPAEPCPAPESCRPEDIKIVGKGEKCIKDRHHLCKLNTDHRDCSEYKKYCN